MPYIGDEYIPRGRGRRGASGEALLSGGRRGAGSWQQYHGGGRKAPPPKWDTDAGSSGGNDLLREAGNLETQKPIPTTGSSLETQPVNKTLADKMRAGPDRTRSRATEAEAMGVRQNYDSSKGKRWLDVTGEYGQRMSAHYNELMARAARERQDEDAKFLLDLQATRLEAAGPAQFDRRKVLDQETGNEKQQLLTPKGEWIDEYGWKLTGGKEEDPSYKGPRADLGGRPESWLGEKLFTKEGERSKAEIEKGVITHRGVEERKTNQEKAGQALGYLGKQNEYFGPEAKSRFKKGEKPTQNQILQAIEDEQNVIRAYVMSGEYKGPRPSVEELRQIATRNIYAALGMEPPAGAVTAEPEKPRALGPTSSPSPSPTPSATPSAGRGVPTPSPTPPPAAARPSVTPTPAPRPRYEKIINDKGEAKIWDNVEKKIVGDVR